MMQEKEDRFRLKYDSFFLTAFAEHELQAFASRKFYVLRLTSDCSNIVINKFAYRGLMKKIIMPSISIILKYIVRVFLLISLVLVVLSFIEANRFVIDISYIGAKNLLNIFLAYKEVFSGTLLLTTAYYTIKSFLATKKESTRTAWTNNFKDRLKELRDDNRIIYSRCLFDINRLFDYSYKHKSIFKDETQLKEFLIEFVNPWVDKFEPGSKEYDDAQGVYPNAPYSFSYRTYFEVLIYIGQPTSSFRDDFLDTYEKLYSDILIKSDFGKDRTVNNEKYKTILEAKHQETNTDW